MVLLSQQEISSLDVLFESVDIFRPFFLNFHKVSVRVYQFLVLSEQLSVFLPKITNLSLTFFIVILRKFIHDAVENGDVFVAFHQGRLEGRIPQWYLSLPGREKCTVVFFVMFSTYFGVQQSQLGNPQNMLLLSCFFGKRLYLTLFFTLYYDQIDNRALSLILIFMIRLTISPLFL